MNSARRRGIGAVALGMVVLGDLAAGLLLLKLKVPNGRLEIARVSIADAETLHARQEVPVLRLEPTSDRSEQLVRLKGVEDPVPASQILDRLAAKGIRRVALGVDPATTFGQASELQSLLETHGVELAGYVGRPRRKTGGKNP